MNKRIGGSCWVQVPCAGCETFVEDYRGSVDWDKKVYCQECIKYKMKRYWDEHPEEFEKLKKELADFEKDNDD